MAIDLYDYEVTKAIQVMMQFNEMAKRTRNTPQALKDLGMRLQEEYLKIGLVANVDLSACGIIDPKTGRTHPPDVEIVARLDDPHNVKEIDHDRKRHEILRAKELGVARDGMQGGFANKATTKDAHRKAK